MLVEIQTEISHFSLSSKWLEVTRRRNDIFNSKGKSFPLHAWNVPEGSKKLRFPDFVTTSQGGGKFVSIKHRQTLPQKMFLYTFLLVAVCTPKSMVLSEGIYVKQKLQ